MRFKLFLCLALIPLSVKATIENANHDLVISTLQKHTLNIRVIGALKFCEKPGLAHSIMQRISDSIISDLLDTKDPEMISKGGMLLQTVDISAVGIATGLSLAQMDSNNKKTFCAVAINMADAALSK